MASLTWIVSACLAGLLLLLGSRSPSKRLPPSPRGLLFAGNALQIPSRFIFRKLWEWQKQLGDIYMVSAFGQKILVLGSTAVTSDILDRMAGITSGRPSYSLVTLVTRDMFFSLAPYGELWRRHRRIAHENLNIRAAVAYRSVQEKGAAELVLTLATSPPDLHHVLTSFSGTVIWRAMYGQTSSQMEERIAHMDQIMNFLIRSAAPTTSLVNLFPVLAYLPAIINPWKTYGDEKYHEMEEFLLSCVREGLSTENDTTFVASCMKAKDGELDMTEADLGWIALNLFGAGVETTAYALHFFIQAMMLYPEVAKKAQQIVDSVVGSRIPTFQDRDKLVYIDAIIKELLRWRTIVPVVLREATEDFTYDMYTIPKGAFIMINVWAMNHDPEVFPEPDVFRPERQIDANGKLKAYPADYHDGLLGFGFGRRICPGRDFASNELFITIAYLLWSFDFCKAVDDRGQEITPDPTALEDQNIVVYPSTFPYVLRPRRDLNEAFGYAC